MGDGPVHLHVCHGITPEMICRFNGACYGEICICPSICLKKEADLTDEDKASIARSAQMDEATS